MQWQNGQVYRCSPDLPLKPGLGDGEVAVAPPRPLAPVVGDHGVQPAQRAPGLAAAHLLHRNLGTKNIQNGAKKYLTIRVPQF